jgi:hypothetical protein
MWPADQQRDDRRKKLAHLASGGSQCGPLTNSGTT